MAKKSHKALLHERRKKRVRKSIHGTSEYPRLSVTRSSKHIYAQVIDDTRGHTLAEASSVSLSIAGGNIDAAKQVGKALAERAGDKSIRVVRFDRRGRLFHGRVKALADAAREAGLKF